jgi:hypothetical protein
LPLAGRAATDVEEGAFVGDDDDSARDGLCGAVTEGASVALAASLSVLVDMSPVLIPDGPTAMGTTTTTVWPPSSTDVLVIVDCVVPVGSACPSSLDTVCALLVGRGGDKGDDPTVFEAAA